MARQQEPEWPDLSTVIGLLRTAVHRMEPKYLSGKEAAELVKVFAEGERLCSAGKTLAARAVERSTAWHGQGHKSAAHWLAAQTGVAVGQAVGTLETGRRLEHLSATTAAFASGELSETRVREVAVAAAACPSSEHELLETARTETVPALKERCRNVVAAATDETERYARIRKNRLFRHWTDVTGAFRLEASLTPDAGATLLAAMEPHRDRITRQARKAGRTETREAYAADALVAMVRDRAGSSGGPKSMVHVVADHAALLRGHVEPGEVCEIPGMGSVPVAVARALASDCFLKVLLTDGIDVTAVAHAGRTISASLRTALDARDPTCVVKGCDVREGLEYDHVIPFAEGGPTSKENLVRQCEWHHYLKTQCGYRLVGGHGNWTLVGPDPPG
jgi:hypothetical protein